MNTLRLQAATAALAFTPRDERTSTRVKLAAGFAALLTRAEPGSDHQLAFANSVVQLVASEAGAALIHGWLDGEEVPLELTIDTDMRWRVVTSLARIGVFQDADIDAELARDNTISGAESAAGARAALNSPEAKAAAWARATEDAGVPNATHRAICAHFGNYGQEELLDPYVERYFDVALAISEQRGDWATRGHAASQAVLVSLFPEQVADAELIERTDRFLAEHDLADSVVRVLRERRDNAARNLRCQATTRA